MAFDIRFEMICCTLNGSTLMEKPSCRIGYKGEIDLVLTHPFQLFIEIEIDVINELFN
jgi:hypothetical protein